MNEQTQPAGSSPVQRPVRPSPELHDKLRCGVAMLMLAIERAQREHPGAKIKLIIAAEEADGGGHIAARLDNAEFIADVAALVGPSAR